MKGSGMPQMRAAFGGWNRRITLARRTQPIINGLVVDVDRPFTFRGTIQPLNPAQIALKPEGLRAWPWLQIHCISTDASLLQPNDKIVWNRQVYKVMAQNDYSLNGFVEYHAVKDFQ